MTPYRPFDARVFGPAFQPGPFGPGPLESRQQVLRGDVPVMTHNMTLADRQARLGPILPAGSWIRIVGEAVGGDRGPYTIQTAWGEFEVVGEDLARAGVRIKASPRPVGGEATIGSWPPIIGSWPPIVGGIDGGECDPGLAGTKFIWPSDVDRFKAQLDPLVRATNSSIETCAALTPADKADWARFFNEWQSFAARKTPTFGSANEWDHACASSRVVDGWREKIKKASCTLVGPDEIKGGDNEKIVDAVKALTKTVIVVGAIVTLVVYAPEIKAGLSAVLPKRKS